MAVPCDTAKFREETSKMQVRQSASASLIVWWCTPVRKSFFAAQHFVISER